MGELMPEHNVTFDVEESVGTRIIAELDKRVAGVIKEFQDSPLGQLLVEPVLQPV